MVVVKWSEETECNCCFLADSVIAFSDVPPWLQSQRPDLWCSPGAVVLPKATGTLSPTFPNNVDKQIHEPPMGGLKNVAIAPPKWRADSPA